MELLAGLLAPLYCVACGASSDGDLCPGCASALEPIVAPMCDRCGAPVPQPVVSCPGCATLRGFARARSLVRYEGPARKMVLALKRRGRAGLASAAGGLLAESALAHGLTTDAVVAVPAGKRATPKGFDHAELLARSVARALGARYEPWLVRTSEGSRQSDARGDERRSNAARAFGARPSVRGDVLLIDDVFTTGATVDACAWALVEGGAGRVDVATFARAVRRFGHPNGLAILDP